MKKLIKKEFQENAAGVVIGIVGYSAMLAIYHYASRPLPNGRVILDLDYLRFLSVFISVLFGLFLGGKQTHAELQMDLMAFLIHRPMSRSRIFLTKTVAGLSIYSILTVLPILGFGIYLSARYPSEFAWSMLPSPTIAWLSGVMCYFVAILTTLRKARWYATKLSAIIFGGCVFLEAFKFNPFVEGQASLNFFLLVGTGILALASWGAFLGNGELKGQPLMSRMVLTFILTVFCAVSLYFVISTVYVLSRVMANKVSHDSVPTVVELLFLPMLSFVIENEAINPSKIIQKLAVALIVVIPLGCAVAYRYRFGLLRQLGWALFYLCFGLPGFLAFLAVHDWPQIVKCSKCGKDRTVDREQCPRCGAGFEPAAEIGIEIFEKSPIRA